MGVLLLMLVAFVCVAGAVICLLRLDRMAPLSTLRDETGARADEPDDSLFLLVLTGAFFLLLFVVLI